MSIAKDLDRALAGRPTEDAEIGSLVAIARELDLTFAAEPASSPRERAMFIAGVGARRRGVSLGRFLVPGLAILLVVVVGIAGRFALPGDALYPVRQVLQTLRLAPSPWKAVDQNIARAARLVVAAETALRAQELVEAEASADAALARLNDAEAGLEGLEGEGKIARVLEISGLQDRAEEVIAAVERAEDVPDPSDRGPEPGSNDSGRRNDEDDEGDDADDDDDGGDGPDDGDDDARDETNDDDGRDGDGDNSGPGGGGDGDGDGVETLDGGDGDEGADTIDGAGTAND